MGPFGRLPPGDVHQMPRVLLILSLLALGPAVAMAQGAAGGEPLFAVHRQPAIPQVSLRMSLLVDDPPGFAGAGHLIQHLQYASLQNQAQAVGAQVRIERTTDAIVYSVTGPAAELHFLAGILRSTLQPPRASARPAAMSAACFCRWTTKRLLRAATAGRN